MNVKDDLEDKIIAVTGVSKDESKCGFKVFKDLVSKNLRVYGVNPNADVVLNRKIYKKISEIPEKVDIVVTVVPPKITENIVDECKNLGINEIWMQPGSESEEAIKKAENFGINVTYNACIMLETEKKTKF
ncbi:MAG: CoA-binding protein [Candidatus Altiarchaeales archaeon HGW-Altiarchaeales-1]|nr:MAG: CoA-binding protein [Candidatus Altiarchaeales archaeon HGW-Altiarchaeales-1]